VVATTRRAVARAIVSVLPLLLVAVVIGDYGKRW
jgi:hypothetical protein